MSEKKLGRESPQEVYASMLPGYGDAARRAPQPCALRFRNPHRINSLADIRSEEERKQLIESCSYYDGEDVPLELRLSTDPKHWEVSFANILEVWDVERDEQLAYKAFIYRGDSGNICVHDSIECVAEIIQCHFHGDDESLKEELRQALAWLPQDYPKQTWQLRGIQ